MAEDMPTDAIALLKADHRKVEELFEEFDKARRSDRKAAIVAEICTELKAHTIIEEEIFYPAVKPKIDAAIVEEGVVEHDGAKVIINDLEAGNPEDEYYDAKVKVLSEEIEHHVKEEEMPSEGMFAQARKTDVDLVALRDAMLARKQELMAQAESEGLPPAQPSAVNPQPA